MTASCAAATQVDVRSQLARCLTATPVPWQKTGCDSDAWLRACDDHGVTALIHQQVQRQGGQLDWPADLRHELAARTRLAAVCELARGREIARVLASLGDAGIVPILVKGAPLAYTVYEDPWLRPRGDTDVLVPYERVEDVRRIVTALGYESSPCAGGEFLFGQFGMQRTDGCVTHAFDIHWKISSRSLFADVLTYDELAADSQPVVSLGAGARTASTVHALLLACVHPAMHHRNSDRLIWTMDVHLLAMHLPPSDLSLFVVLALEKGVASVCHAALRRSIATFGTTVPDAVMVQLRSARAEPTGFYIEPANRWHQEQIVNLRGLPNWRSRLGLLRETTFPNAQYMKQKYAVTGARWGAGVLPALYLHRGARGAWKVLSSYLRPSSPPLPSNKDAHLGAGHGT